MGIIKRSKNNIFNNYDNIIYNIFNGVKNILLISLILLIIIYNNSSNKIKFINILPCINYNGNKPKYIKEIFKGRKLFINKANITSDYIKYIRSTDIRSNRSIQISKKNMGKKFDDNYFIKRKDQYNFSAYRNFCNAESIITFNKTKPNNKPLISIILPTYNKRDTLIKSLRSIQIQTLENFEIIIVDDASKDFDSDFYDLLLKSDSRIRIIYHLYNMGVWRSRIDGFLYSKGKYILFFDPDDLYEDNYVLEDLYSLIEKYHLDSVKALFRSIYDYNNLTSYKKCFEINFNYTQIAKKTEINSYNHFYMKWAYGTVWNRLVRSDIFSKGLCLLSETVLNMYKNVWDDIWWNKMANEISNNYLIVKRIGYQYYRKYEGEGTIKLKSESNKDRMIQEFIKFLYFDYEYSPKKSNKKKIIKKILSYNGNNKISLKHMKSNFYILDDLLKTLLKDPYVRDRDKKKINELLVDSSKRQENILKKNK